MTIRNGPLFRSDGKGTPLFFSLWRSKGPLQPIQSSAVLVRSDGTGTDYFRSQWKASFPIRRALPQLPLANKDGTGTLDFWDVFS